GPQSYHRLPELLREAESRTGVIDTDFPAEDKFARLPASAPGAVARRVVAAAAAVPEVARVRYATSHPNDMSDYLIAAHRDVEALAPYLHLPVQSGSDRILASMNRRHRAADYLAVVAQVRAARPDVALSSDFIVGYPGETEADFEATLDLVRAVGFASSFAFKYSARPGTPAAEMGGQVDEGVKSSRLAALQAL